MKQLNVAQCKFTCRKSRTTPTLFTYTEPNITVRRGQMKNITTKAQSSVGKLSHQDGGLLGFCFLPACSSSAWCRGPASPSSTFSCCSNTPRRSARVNAANVFWYPDHSKNTVNTNQIKRRSFKRASNNSDAYKRLKNLYPCLQRGTGQGCGSALVSKLPLVTSQVVHERWGLPPSQLG